MTVTHYVFEKEGKTLEERAAAMGAELVEVEDGYEARQPNGRMVGFWKKGLAIGFEAEKKAIDTKGTS